jgi:hypothetical protein
MAVRVYTYGICGGSCVYVVYVLTWHIGWSIGVKYIWRLAMIDCANVVQAWFSQSSFLR